MDRHHHQEPEHEYEYLLVKRQNPPGAGTWSLPGGKIRLGESVLQAGQREVLEETGIPCDALQWIPETAGYNDVIFWSSPSPSTSESVEYDPPVGGTNRDEQAKEPVLQFHYVLTQLVAVVDNSAGGLAGVDLQAGDDAAALRWESVARLASGDVEMVGFDVVEHLTKVDAILARIHSGGPVRGGEQIPVA